MKKIKEASVEIFGGCNYKCISCPQSVGREKEFLGSLDLELFKKIVNDLEQHSCKSISLQGSGEPLLHPLIHEFIEILSNKGIKSHLISNGSRLNRKNAERLFKAGLDSLRVSIIGYTNADYQLSMGTQYQLEETLLNIKNATEIAAKLNSNCKLSVYHLILSNKGSINSQIENYLLLTKDISNLGIEIWQPHNWAGASPYEIKNFEREKGNKRSCGRPQAEYLTVRAGGINGHKAAVVPCCFVLGTDSKAVLGHLDNMTIQEVLDSKSYKELVHAHEINEYENFDYCNNCDQLFQCPDALVWTNVKGRKIGQSHTGTNEDAVVFGL